MKNVLGFWLATVLVTVAHAQKQAVSLNRESGWRKIGEATVSFDRRNESIAVSCQGQFDAIKLKATNASITIGRLQVFYDSGEMNDFNVEDHISTGHETARFALNSDDEVTRVVFTYRTIANDTGKQAKITVFGFVAADTGQTNKSSWKDANNTNDVSKVGSNAEAELKSKLLKTKVGPNGQAIYVEETPMKFYYVDRQGLKVYVEEYQLKEKKDN